MPDPRAHALLLGAVFAAAIVVSVWLRREKTRRITLFVVFCGTLALWYALLLLAAWVPEVYWHRGADVALVLLPQAALRFFRAFLGEEGRRSRFVSVGTVFGVLAMAAVASPLWSTRAMPAILLVYCGGLLYGALVQLYRGSRSVASRVESARIQILVIGGALALTFSLLDYLPAVGVEFPPLGPLLTLIFMYTLSQALVRYRLFDLYELVGRFAVLTALALTLAGIFYALVQWAETSRYFFLNAVAAGFVILILFDPLRTMVEQKIGEILVRERFLFETKALELRQRLGRATSVEEIARAVVAAFEESRRFTHGSLYLLTADGLTLARRGHFGPEPATSLEVAAARPLLDALTGREVLLRSSVESRRNRFAADGQPARAEALDPVLHLLADLRADLVLPVRGEDRVLGLLAVKDERVPEGVAEEDARTLGLVAAQIAFAAESFEMYQRMKIRDRMAVVGEMSAGLAHEIRNPLGSIKAAAQILADYRTPQTSGMIDVLVEESNRLNRVVTEFLEYARPRPSGGARADVAEVLRRCEQILRAEHGEALVIETITGEGLPEVPVDPERLVQVFLNLALNAAQAMNGAGRLEIAAMVRRDSGPTFAERPGGSNAPRKHVLVRFRDHGPGIPPEILPRIFIPFFTTKDRGTGLGLAISQRIVEDAGGTIEVRSEVGQGATFTVVLPAAEPKTQQEPGQEA